MNIDTKILDQFEDIQLQDMDEVSLLNRTDTKFIFHESKLNEALVVLSPYYKMLNINGVNQFQYNNTYFDTKDKLFFLQHHNENRNRYKVRFRQYSESDDCFFEIKIKNNKNRTIKKRLRVKKDSLKFGEKESNLINTYVNISSEILSQSLQVNFSRITLVDNRFTERLTIDRNLIVKNGVHKNIFEKLVIAEIKQSKFNTSSPFIKVMRESGIHDNKFSKYYMGMLHVNNDIKYNRFKPRLLQLNKLLKTHQDSGLINEYYPRAI